MATTRIGARGVGEAWAIALGLWVDFANGVYTSWAYALSILNSGYDIEVTVGLSGGGTDVKKIQPLETNWNDHLTLVEVFTSPGWRTMPQVLLPATVPGGGAVDTSFNNGPWQLRSDIILSWCNSSGFHNTNDQYSAPEGAQTTVYRQVYKRGNQIFVDVLGIMWSTLTGLDEVTGQVTDFIGQAPMLVSSGGGAAPDLAPLTAAVASLREPLIDIGAMDVSYDANNGQATITFRGRVATE